MGSSTRGPSRSPVYRLMARFAAVVLVGVLSLLVVSGPASAASVRSGGVYQPNCYVLCLSYTYDGSTGWHLTATTYLYDVGPTPYYISIFNTLTGERLAVCGYGTQCTTDQLGSSGLPCFTFIAYVGGSGMSMPPAPVQITSPTLTKCFGAG